MDKQPSWTVREEIDEESASLWMEEAMITDPKVLFGKLLIKSALFALIIKYGEVLFRFPFDRQHSEMAFIFILFPTVINLLRWVIRSQSLSRNKEKESYTT